MSKNEKKKSTLPPYTPDDICNMATNKDGTHLPKELILVKGHWPMVDFSLGEICQNAPIHPKEQGEPPVKVKEDKEITSGPSKGEGESG